MTNSWQDDPWAPDAPDQPPDDGNGNYYDNPPHDSADDPWAQPGWGDAPNGTNDQGPDNPYTQGYTLPNYDPQGPQDQYTNYPGDIGGGKQPLDPFDPNAYQAGQGQGTERNAQGDTSVASSFDYAPTPGQQGGTLPIQPLQDYHDQLMDEIVNGNLNAQPQDDGSWVVTPKIDQTPPDYNQLLSDNGNIGDVPYDPTAAAQKYYDAWASQNTGDVPVDAYASVASEISKLYPQPDLTPTDQDANTPGVTQANTLLGRLQQARFNAADPTAGNVASDAATKLLEAAVIGTAATTLSVAAFSPAAEFDGALGNVFSDVYSTQSNGVAKWAADFAIRSGISSVIGNKAKNLPGPLPGIAGMAAFTVGNGSGLLGALEDAALLSGSVQAADKVLPDWTKGPSLPVFGNARDFLTMFLVGGLKGRFNEHIKAANEVLVGAKLPTEAESGFKFNDDGTVVLDRFGRRPMNISPQDIAANYNSYESLLSPKQKAFIESRADLSRTSITLPDSVAEALNHQQEAVRLAAPDDLVNVFHGTSGPNAESINLNGLDENSWLTTDPEMAAAHAMNNGAENATVLSFTVPRSSLRQSGPFFQSNEILTPNEVRVPDHVNAVRTWVSQIVPAKQPSFQGVTNTGAVEDLAFGASGMTGESTGMQRIDEQSRQGRVAPTVDFGDLQRLDIGDYQAVGPDLRVSKNRSADGGMEFQVKGGGIDKTFKTTADAKEAIDDYYEKRVTTTSGPTGITSDDVKTRFTTAGQDVANLLPKLDALKEQINGGATTTGVIKDYLQAREDTLRALTAVHEHGAELAARSGGTDGLPTSIRQAVKQFLADEEGSLRLPQRTPEGKYTIPTAATPLTDTLLGAGPINPHLTPAQRMVNVVKDLSGKGVYNDPLAQGIRNFKAKARSVMSSMGANVRHQVLSRQDVFKFNKDGTVHLDLGPASTALEPTTPAFHPEVPQVGGDISAVTKVTINGETRYRIVKRDGSTSYYIPDKEVIPTAAKSATPANFADVHLQTMAADYSNWAPLLNDKQKAYMEWARDVIKPIEAARQEMGIPSGLAPDIKPGGFYLPRGDAMTEEWAQDGNHTPTNKKRGVKTGSEQPRRWNSMEEATKAGYTYMPFHEAMQTYIETNGRRLADQRVNTALRGALDDNGTPVAQTPQSIVIANDPVLKAHMDFLKKSVSSLTTSIRGLDARSRDVLEKFASNPAVSDADWEALNNTLDAVYTKGGTLRIRTGLQPGSDVRTNAAMLRKQVVDTAGAARRQYSKTSQSIQDINIRRGTFKGMDIETANNTLKAVKDQIKAIKPMYDASVRVLSQAEGKTLTNSGFGSQLQNFTFPNRLANDLNRGLAADQPKNGNLFSISNNLLRAARLSGDLATITTHGTIALFNSLYNPMMAARVLKTTLNSVRDPAALGDLLRDFDAKRAKDGNPNTTEWAQANSHIGDSGTGIVGLNRVYAAGTTAWRMELNNAAWDKSYNSLPADQRIQKMREIAATNNLVTGYAPESFGGPASSLLLAPRLIQSQIDLLMKGIDPRGGITGVGGARQKLLTYFGVATALTVAANESGIFGSTPGFNYLSPWVNGRPNPDFMRVNVGGKMGKVSLLGAYDWMYHAVGAASQGDLSYFPRTKAGPLASVAWDLISGKDFLGHPIGVNPLHPTKDFDPTRVIPWLASSVLPIAPSEGVAAYARGQLGAGPEVSIKDAAAQSLINESGIKHTTPTAAAEFAGLRQDTFQKMLKDGSIPPDVATLVKDMPYSDLPLGVQKQVDATIKSNSPDDYNWYHEQRLDQGNIYEEKLQAADDQRAKYNAKFDDLNKDLKAGVDPFVVWSAYETDKNQRTGALAAVYDDPAYQKAVSNLPQSDMRKLEVDYDNITFGPGQKAIEKFTADDWANVQLKQQNFMNDLKLNHPEQAAMLQYSLDQRDKLGVDNASELEQLKKKANTTLEPYYQLAQAEKTAGKDNSGSQKWLAANPDADYLHWLTEKPLTPDTTPKLHSPLAAAQAVAAYANTQRPVELVGSKQPITGQNLPILQKYAKQIIQITTLPGKQLDPDTGKEYSPVQRLRQTDPVYDALYTWLFAIPQKDKDGRSYVTMYHTDYVNSFLSQVGGRHDKVKPRTSGNSSFAF